MREPLVFISYTAADRETARAVAAGLKRRGVAYFLDEEHSEPGEPIDQMIERWLERSTHLFFVASRHGLEAGWPRAEAALGNEMAINGKLVFVPGLLGIQRHDLRGLLRNWVPLDLADLEVSLNRLAESIRRTAARPAGPTLGDLKGVPPPPRHYVPRPEHLDPLRALLLSGAGPVGVTSSATALGMHGMGGVGKTVLATALARDEAVRAAYPDGILWLVAGEKAEPLALQHALARSLGEAQPAFANIYDGDARLRALLQGRTPLVVLDDVWTPEVLEAFRCVEPPAALLVTSRLENLLRGAGVHVQPIVEMKPSEAECLLARHLGMAPADLPQVGRELVQRLGEHPLAIAICASRVRPGSHRAERLADILRSVKAVDHTFLSAHLPGYAQHSTVFDSLAASLGAVDAPTQAAFSDLAIFPEDTAVPMPVLGKLWGEGHAGFIADALVDAALASYDARGRLVLHDLQRDFARFQAGDTLVERHRRLTEAYRAACGGDWRRLDDGGYVFQHLPWHLAQGGEREALRALLLDYGWIEAKLAALGPSAFPADYRLMAEDAAVRRVGATLDLSAHLLARERPAERRWLLPGQLLGRLEAADGPEIVALRGQAAAQGPRPALLPRRPLLTQADGGLVRTLMGHTGAVSAVVFHPDGCRALSGSWDNTLGLWDLDSGILIRRFEGHTGSVNSVALSADGRRVISCSSDNTIGLWDLDSGDLIRWLEGHTGAVYAVAVSSDGSHVLSGSADKTLGLWNLDSGTLIRRLEGHAYAVIAVSLSTDGHRAFSSSWDTMLVLWDLDSGTIIRRLWGHTERVNAVALNADARRALFGHSDRTLELWDLDNGTLIRRLDGLIGDAAAVALSADGHRALSANGPILYLWDMDSRRPLVRRLDGHVESVIATAMSGNGSRALSGSFDNTLKLWDLDCSLQARRPEKHTGSVTAVALSADGRRAVSSSDKALELWDVESGAEIQCLKGHADRITAVALSADGRRAISGSSDKTLGLWDLDNLSSIRRLAAQGDWARRVGLNVEGQYWLRGHTGTVTALALSADGRRAISGSSDNTLGLWDLDSRSLIRWLEGHTGEVNAAALSTDGSRALSGSADKTLGLWDLDNGTLIRRLEGHTGEVNAAALSTDGSRALSGSTRDNTLALWDLDCGSLIRRLEGHTDGVNAVAICADGRRALSASTDCTVRLWDLATGACLAVAGCDHRVTAVATAGAVVVAGDVGGLVHVFDIIET